VSMSWFAGLQTRRFEHLGPHEVAGRFGQPRATGRYISPTLRAGGRACPVHLARRYPSVATSVIDEPSSSSSVAHQHGAARLFAQRREDRGVDTVAKFLGRDRERVALRGRSGGYSSGGSARKS